VLVLVLVLVSKLVSAGGGDVRLRRRRELYKVSDIVSNGCEGCDDTDNGCSYCV
jgi:hypothetical protein